jgi:hypothetical protein
MLPIVDKINTVPLQNSRNNPLSAFIFLLPETFDRYVNRKGFSRDLERWCEYLSAGRSLISRVLFLGVRQYRQYRTF